MKMEDKPKEIKKTKKESEKKETQNLDQNKQKDQSVSNFEIENSVLLYPVSTEKAINSIESQNQIVFAVKLKATKKQIKEEFEKLFNVKVKKINTKISMKGVKHAYIKLKEGKADEIAMQLKMI
jgi:large subunit ribosomal protein L23